MKITKIQALDQNSELMEELTVRNMTTTGICGYVTCAIVQFLAKSQFNVALLKSINQKIMAPYIEEVMKRILNRRRMQIKKYRITTDQERKAYLKDYVANYEIQDQLQSQINNLSNKQVYFWRQAAYDHPELLKNLKHQQQMRVQQEQQFKGTKYFFTQFGQKKHRFKQQFVQILKNSDKSKPILIATDILGHYYTTVLFEGQIYILDSLSAFMQTSFDSTIVECIQYYFKKSFLKQ